MFCHNCGANWPDTTKFCGKCGTVLAAYPPPADEDGTVAVEPPIAEAPVLAPPVAAEPETESPVVEPIPTPEPVAPKEPRYIPTPKHPSRAIKPLSLAITLLMVFSMLLVLISGVKMLGTNVSEMGAITWGMDLFYNFDLEEELEDLEDTRRDISKELTLQEADMTKDQIESAETMEKQLKNIQDDNSITKLFLFGQYLIDEADDGVFHIDDIDGLKQFVSLKTVIYIVLAALYLLPLLFNLIGGLAKSGAMNIVAMLLTLMVQLLFATPFLLILITMVLYLAQIILCYILKHLKSTR